MFLESEFVLQNRIASENAVLGKAVQTTKPTLRPRAALGEIGNVAVSVQGPQRVNGRPRLERIQIPCAFKIIKSTKTR